MPLPTATSCALPNRGAIVTAGDRHRWLNAVLEAQIAGEAYASVARSLIAAATATAGSLQESFVPAALSALVSGDYLGVVSDASPTLCASLLSVVSAVLRNKTSKHTGAAAAAAGAAAGVEPAQWYDALTLAITAWITNSTSADTTANPATPASTATASARPDAMSALEERDTFALLCGVAFLSAYTQVNTAGIPLARSLPATTDSATAASAAAPAAVPAHIALLEGFVLSPPARVRAALPAALRLNGEDAYPCLHYPLLLLLARALLTGVYDRRHARPPTSFALPAARLWALRALAAHHAALLDNTASLAEAAKVVFRDLEVGYRLGAFKAVRAFPTVVSDKDHFSDTEADTDASAPASDASDADSATGSDSDAGAPGGGDDGDDDDEGVEDGEGGKTAGGATRLVSAGMVPSATAAAGYQMPLPPLPAPPAPLPAPAPGTAAGGHWHPLTAAADATVSADASASANASACGAAGAGGALVAAPVLRALRRTVRASVCLEAAAMARHYWQFALAKRLLAAGVAASGCAARLTGAMGVRTRYQQDAKAQLMLVGATEAAMLTVTTAAAAAGSVSTSASCASASSCGNTVKVTPAGAIAKTIAKTYLKSINSNDGDNSTATGALTFDRPDDGSSLDGTYIAESPIDAYDNTLLLLPAVDASTAGSAVPLLPAAARATAAGNTFSALGQAAALAFAEHIQAAQAVGEIATQEVLAYVYAPLTQEARHGGYDDTLKTEPVAAGADGAASADGAETRVLTAAEEDARKLKQAQTADANAETSAAATETVSPTAHQVEEELPVLGLPTTVGVTVSSTGSLARDALLTRPSWATHLLCLYQRSRLEIGDFRRQIRSFAQFELMGHLYPPSLAALAPARLPCRAPRTLSDGRPNPLHAPHLAPAARAASLSLVRWRMSGLFTSMLPPWWLTRRGFADIAIKAQLRQTALDAFVQIGLWEAVVETYIQLGRNAQAEELVRARLPGKGYLAEAEPINNIGTEPPSADADADVNDGACATPEAAGNDDEDDDEVAAVTTEDVLESEQPLTNAQHALATDAVVRSRFSIMAGDSVSLQKRGLDLPQYKLWALLGDLRRDPAYYARSWAESGASYPRAQRSLGSMAMAARRFQAAHDHFVLALEINPANAEIWFAAGACCMELRQWDGAIRCFTATVNTKPTYPDGWNNLAAAHINQGNKRSAFAALEHTVRLNRKSWKVWENYLHCALDLRKYQAAAAAMSALADLRGTTDAGTLLPVQFSGHQAQLHMMALGELTRAAVADAKEAFAKNVASKHSAAAAGAGAAAAAAEFDGSAMAVSFLSHKLIEVLVKFEGISASVAAQESNLGGRKRGGGEAAGAGNSITALLDVRRRANRDKLAALQQARAEAEARGETVPADLAEQISRLQAKDDASEAPFMPVAAAGAAGAATGDIHGKLVNVSQRSQDEFAAAEKQKQDQHDERDADGDAETDKDEDEEENDVVGELAPLPSKSSRAGATAPDADEKLRVHALPSGLSSGMAPANAPLFTSLGQQYQCFIQDCLARVYAGVQQYAQAALSCEKRAALFTKSGSGWEDNADAVEEAESAVIEAVQYYKLACDVETHIAATAAAAETRQQATAAAAAAATAARLLTSRLHGMFDLAARQAKSARAAQAAAAMTAKLAYIATWAASVASSGGSAEASTGKSVGPSADDGYGGYGGDSGYDDWR